MGILLFQCEVSNYLNFQNYQKVTQSSFKMTIKNLIRFEQLAQMSPEERAAENQRVWDIRAECLVGRTIIGTLTSTNAKGRTFYWIKWNNAKCDTVKVPVS